MKSSWIITGIVVGIVIFGIIISFPILSEHEQVRNQIDRKSLLKELAKKGIVTHNLTGMGQNIVDYRFGVNDVSFSINQELEKTLRQKQKEITDTLATPLYSDKQIDIPANYVTINKEWKAVEIGIEPSFLTEKNIPTYFQEIRSVIGNQTNIVLTPRYPAIPAT